MVVFRLECHVSIINLHPDQRYTSIHQIQLVIVRHWEWWPAFAGGERVSAWDSHFYFSRPPAHSKAACRDSPKDTPTVMFCVSHIGWSVTTTSLLFDPCHYYYYQKRKHPCLIQQHHMMEWFPICQITIMIISFALCICISKNSSIRRDGWRYTLVPHHVIVPVAIGYLCH